MKRILDASPRYTVLIIMLTAFGCANNMNLQVKGEVPKPLAMQIPLNMGVHYNENFRTFLFKEDSDTREKWTIDNRNARIAMFDEILPSMFTAVTPVTDMAAVDPGVDMVFVPDVADMQVALPDETHSDMYEAWLKYDIKLYTTAGELISQWQVTGYGKSHTALFKNREKGLSTAINLALRDIGAKLVLNFPKAPGVKDVLITKIDCSQFSNLC